MGNDKEVRLIDANALKERLKILKAKADNKKYEQGLQDAIDGYFPMIIDDESTIEAKPVKHGRWIKGHCGVNEYIKCSVCRTRIVNTIVSLEGDAAEDYFDLCPKCGSNMREDGDSE